jgi:hypothetical protein
LLSSEIFLELWLLRYRAKGRNEQNVEGVDKINGFIISGNTRARVLFFWFVVITKYLLLLLESRSISFFF